MPELHRVGDLQIDQNLKFQEWEWLAQRIGWVLMSLTLAAAMLGLFGRGGFLADASAGERGGDLWVEYERFGRIETPTIMRVHLRPKATGRLRLWIQRQFIEQFTVEQIVPDPVRAEAMAERFTWEFETKAGDAETTLTFVLKPKDPGRQQGNVGIEGSKSVQVRQFVYP